MTPHACAHEDEVMDVVTAGRWPLACDASLRAHVASCAACRDAVEVATWLREDGDALQAAAHVPSAGALWWRMQVRARAEAEQAAMRPMRIAWACGATVLVALAAAAVSVGGPWTTDALGEGLALLTRVQSGVSVSLDVQPLMERMLDRWLVHVVMAAALLVAAPVALYLAAWE